MNRRLHRPASDPAAVEHHAYRFFLLAAEAEAGCAENRLAQVARVRTAALNPARVGRAGVTGVAVPLAYQLWLAYLLWLEAVLQVLFADPDSLSAVEWAGLQALDRARRRFLQSHQACPHCEAWNPRRLRRCRLCRREV